MESTDSEVEQVHLYAIEQKLAAIEARLLRIENAITSLSECILVFYDQVPTPDNP